MKTQTCLYRDGWQREPDGSLDSERTVVFFFSSLDTGARQEALDSLHHHFPHSHIIGCSGPQAIYHEDILRQVMSVLILRFERTEIETHFCRQSDRDNAYDTGTTLMERFPTDGLKHLFVLSSAWEINGSALTRGIDARLPNGVSITGGVAGNDYNDGESWIYDGQSFQQRAVIAIGFYGESLRIGYGYRAGLDRLGLERKVTKIKDRELYTLDHKPALEIYKRYLGKRADELPASALLFPLAILEEGHEPKIHSVFGINETNNSLILNDDIPENTYVTLMSANFNRLIDGAYVAAEEAFGSSCTDNLPTAVIAISCVGRLHAMGQRTEEEIRAILEVFPAHSNLVGFYSNGEISTTRSGSCSLHNQTMTLTVIQEEVDA
jgi:hypothetical protein